jgi:hypothetical protein
VTRTLPPRCGLRGWPGAWAALEKVRAESRRDLLAELTRSGGIEGAALKYLAQMLCFKAGEAEFPTPPRRLERFEVELIQARAGELLEPFEGDGRFPRMRRRK